MQLTTELRRIKDTVLENKAISRTDAETLYETADDRLLAELATTVRDRKHEPRQATYIIMAIINYTNVCVAACDYCAFYKLPHEEGTYLLDFDEVCRRIDKLRGFGGGLVDFNGGFNPKVKIHDYAGLFARLHERYGNILEFFEMTVAEFMFSCKLSKLSYEEGAVILKNAGTHWITGGGAEILDDAFRRRHSPGKYTAEDYFKAQKAVVEAGIASTATMVIGFDESLAERMNHLERLRRFQDETGGSLPSYLCWTYKPMNTKFGGQEIPTREYLRWLAVARIYLHNFDHIRTSVLTRNEDALKGLLYGADDFDLVTEDEVTEKAGARIDLEFERVLAHAKGLGITVVKRQPWPRISSTT